MDQTPANDNFNPDLLQLLDRPFATTGSMAAAPKACRNAQASASTI